MTDPTNPAATAKMAREVIAEAVRAADELRRSLIENAGLSENPWPGSPHALFKDTLTALRALLDAPEGGVQALLKAGDDALDLIDSVRKEKAHYWEGEGIQRRLAAALAALREGPESVGSANVDLVYAERDIVALKRERDALKADLAAARGEVERLRTEIAGDSHTCANGTVRPYPSVVCSLCVSRGAAPTGHVPDAGKKATPPPATEAPISERIGPYAVDEVRVHPDGVFMVTLVGELEAVRSAGARLFEQVWLVADSAAAERAVKAPQAEG